MLHAKMGKHGTWKRSLSDGSQLIEETLRIPDLDEAINWNCFSLTIGDSYGIDFVVQHSLPFLTACDVS